MGSTLATVRRGMKGLGLMYVYLYVHNVSLHTQCIFTYTMYLYLHTLMYVFFYLHNLTAVVNVRISSRTQCISYVHMIMFVFL